MENEMINETDLVDTNTENDNTVIESEPDQNPTEEQNTINLDFFNVRGCKVTSDMVFDGVVLRVGEENIIDSIKRHLGIKGKLMCELTGETFGIDKADVYSVKLKDLVVGDLMVLLGNTNFLDA